MSALVTIKQAPPATEKNATKIPITSISEYLERILSIAPKIKIVTTALIINIVGMASVPYLFRNAVST
jgi:hypothetical protein